MQRPPTTYKARPVNSDYCCFLSIVFIFSIAILVLLCYVLLTVLQTLKALGIPFHLLLGAPKEQLPLFVSKNSASVVVCDFSPLRVPMGWTNAVAHEMGKLNVPLVQVSVE